MLYPLDDTIAAIASAAGGAARGIVRLSGPDAMACLGHVFTADDEAVRPDGAVATTVISGSLTLPPPWSSTRGEAVAWPTGRSYTGEPAVEIHAIGSPPLLDALLARLCERGARLAGPGEFTLRAFLSGRIDLTRAEAVLGVIDASDMGRLDVALEQLAGGLASPLGELREELIETLAHLEAGFDFADEDIEFIPKEELRERLAEADKAVHRLFSQVTRRGECVEQVRVVLVGRPNAGKSSLFNALAGERAGRRRALVSDAAGTTRDYLVARIDLDGLSVELVDTAGVELPAISETATDGPSVPDQAQNVMRRQRRFAHVELFCLDATRPPCAWEDERLAADRPERLPVWTKCDEENEAYEIEGASRFGRDPIHTSAVTGRGLDALRRTLRAVVLQRTGPTADVVNGTAVRSRDSLRRAAESLARARTLADDDGEEELIASELRICLDELGVVVGVVHSEDVLDRVFSRFCVGK